MRRTLTDWSAAAMVVLSCLLLCGCPLPDDGDNPYDPVEPVEARTPQARITAAARAYILAHEAAAKANAAAIRDGSLTVTSETQSRFHAASAAAKAKFAAEINAAMTAAENPATGAKAEAWDTAARGFRGAVK